MKKGFWRIFGQNLVKVHSVFGVVISITLSILLWKFSSDSQVSLVSFLVLLVTSVLLITALISVVLELLHSEIVLPGIKRVIKVSEEKIVFLLDSSNLFSHGILVSFFYTDKYNYEQLIAVGSVINIQDNGSIQVEIRDYKEVYEDLIMKAVNNDKDVLKEITVKPSAPSNE
ncbi:hypothetical protein [Bacillus mycoides]|uniref:hypothetical protein n=1 Tax=Bacillus mycoides TaxID=1405 RepID=UPI002DFE995D|nr:hypothetical protein [Bacillus mycoides]MEC5262852.1 hypothetical protein [Bacillus mycoides]